MEIVLAITNILNRKNTKVKRDVQRERRQIDPLFEEEARRQQLLFEIGFNDLFTADNYLGKPAIRMRNGLAELEGLHFYVVSIYICCNLICMVLPGSKVHNFI